MPGLFHFSGAQKPLVLQAFRVFVTATRLSLTDYLKRTYNQPFPHRPHSHFSLYLPSFLLFATGIFKNPCFCRSKRTLVQPFHPVFAVFFSTTFGELLSQFPAFLAKKISITTYISRTYNT
jgi:hypothetical protein